MAHHIWPVTLASGTSHGHLAYHRITQAFSMSQYIWHIGIWHVTVYGITLASRSLAHHSCLSGMSLSQPSSSGKTGVRGRYIALFLRVETFHPHPPALLLAQQPANQSVW